MILKINSPEGISLTSKRKKAQLNGLSDDEIIEHYLRYKSNLSLQTLKNYKYCLFKFQKFCMKHKQSILSVDGELLSDFLAQYSYKTTKETYRVTLNIFYKWCVKMKEIEDNPVEDISMSSGKKQAMVAMKVKDFLEIQRKSQSLRQLTIVSCLWYTGMRSKELRFLKLDDIDLKNGVIRISHSKTVTGYRTIPIHPSFRPLLAKYMQKRVSLDVDTDWALLTKRGTQFSDRTFVHFITQCQVDLDCKFTAHDFRRAFITRLYRKTKDLVLCQRLAGHTSIKTTRRYIIDDIEEHIRKFNSLNF